MPTERKIEIVAYDPSWPDLFEAESNLLRHTLGEIMIGIHHIGSTAVPGLSAKPIIDILLEVKDVVALDNLNREMEDIGYEAKGEFGIPGRRYFQKGGKDRTHHVHAFVHDDSNVIRHIAFREYLRNHPKVAQEYAEIKNNAAATCGNDINRYYDGKDSFVKRVETIAMKELALNSGVEVVDQFYKNRDYMR